MKNSSKKKNTRRINKKTKINGKKRISNGKTVNKRLIGSGLSSMVKRFFKTKKLNNPLSTSSANSAAAAYTELVDGKQKMKNQEMKNIKIDQIVLNEIANTIKENGIRLMLFDFDQTASKKHIYSILKKVEILSEKGKILADIIKTIKDEKTEKSIGTYFSKCFEQTTYNDDGKKNQYLLSNSYFFPELVKALYKVNILVGIVSRGDCNVIQQVLNAVFKDEEERNIYIPDERIEGGDEKSMKEGNPRCHGGIGRSSGKNKYKNEAIKALLFDNTINPGTKIIFACEEIPISSLNLSL